MITGPIGSVLVAIAVIVALIVWLRRDRRYPGPRLHGVELHGIDREELEEAEREVRDLDPRHPPDEGFLGDDWGPGAARRPRPPERL